MINAVTRIKSVVMPELVPTGPRPFGHQWVVILLQGDYLLNSCSICPMEGKERTKKGVGMDSECQLRDRQDLTCTALLTSPSHPVCPHVTNEETEFSFLLMKSCLGG